jgi:uncharacterized membrane protein
MNIGTRRAVGTFPNRREAEKALHELKNSGFLMDKVSIIAKDADNERDIADVEVEDKEKFGNKADEGATAGAVTGGLTGGLTGLLVGLGALAIPGIGPIMLAGAEATALATTLAGGAIGAAAGSLLGALVGLGIPEERAKVYNDRVSSGEYLVVVNGTEAEIERALAIFNRYGIQEWGVYDIPNTSATNNIDRPTTLDSMATTSPAMSTPNMPRNMADETIERDRHLRSDSAYANSSPEAEVIEHSQNTKIETVDSTHTTNLEKDIDRDPEVIIIDRRTPSPNN